MTSKERVLRTLEFTNTQERVPRQFWSLPWAQEHCPEMMEQLLRDFDGPDTVLKKRPVIKGDLYAVVEYVDERDCIAQCEFGPGSKPENVYRVYQAWENVRNG